MNKIKLNPSYEKIHTKRCSIVYRNSAGIRPRCVEIYNDGSWAAYAISHNCLPERTGFSTSNFNEYYPEASVSGHDHRAASVVAGE